MDKAALHRMEIKAAPLLERFPFPFQADSYRYSNNSRALVPPVCTDLTPEYFEEIGGKRKLLERYPERTFQAFPHTVEAQWEIMAMLMNELAAVHSDYFKLDKQGVQWTFYNRLLDEKSTFVFGDLSTLPYEPLDFIGRHVQEDLIYLQQRDGDLYMDAGQLCFPANWSLAFDLGMTYLQFHSPVPIYSDSGLAEKVRGFLLRMEAGKPWTRLNWTLNVGPRLDTSPEAFGEWGVGRFGLNLENVGEIMHLRAEDQRLFQIPGSNGVLFSIHTHLLPFDQLINNKTWADRFCKVLEDLPDPIAEYKGFLSYKPLLIEYLKQHI
ncbi:MAG: heme-dependent oxidative N-demethylase family protein [Bacillota bacterium]